MALLRWKTGTVNSSRLKGLPACHLAIGKAYPCFRNADKMSQEEMERLGMNDSLVHEDFMIGTEDMEITGVTWSGDEIPVFNKGNFAFE